MEVITDIVVVPAAMVGPDIPLDMLLASPKLVEQFESLDSIETLKDLRSKSELFHAYLGRREKAEVERNRAAELKVRTERQLGDVLTRVVPPGGDRHSSSSSTRLTLKELGISKAHCANWKLIASIPDDDFEDFLQSELRSGHELTSISFVEYAKTLRDAKAATVATRKETKKAKQRRSADSKKSAALVATNDRLTKGKRRLPVGAKDSPSIDVTVAPHGDDIRPLRSKGADDSVDLALANSRFADPEACRRIVELAARKSKEGSLCLAYSKNGDLVHIVRAQLSDCTDV